METLKKPSSADTRSKMNRLLVVSLVALVSYMSLIFYLSGQPADVSAGVEILEIPRIILHMGEYAILGLLMNSAMMQVSSKVPRSVFFSSAFCCLYGVTDEIHQFFVPTRCFDIYDILADTIGGIAGAVFLVILLTLMKVEKTRSQEIRRDEAHSG